MEEPISNYSLHVLGPALSSALLGKIAEGLILQNNLRIRESFHIAFDINWRIHVLIYDRGDPARRDGPVQNCP